MNDANMNQNQTPVPVRQDRRGSNNPFYGHRHTTQSREKMSQAAIERNKQYQKWRDSQHHLTMDEFLSAHPSVEEYIKSLASKVIKEEIKKLIWRKQNERIQIPNAWE